MKCTKCRKYILNLLISKPIFQAKNNSFSSNSVGGCVITIGNVPRNLSQQGNKFFSFTKYFYIIDVISLVSF